MAYNPLVFTVGQVLTATQMGLLQNNVDTVRISHRGPSPPTSPPGGAMWWDDTQPIWNLNLNTGSGSWIPAIFLDTQSREAGMAAQGKAWGSVPMVNREQTRTVFAGQPSFPKNMLLNGNFQYWQRGPSFNTIATRSYHADRWITELVGGGRYTVRQSSLVPVGIAGDYSMELVVGSARTTMAPGDVWNAMQPVEGSVLGKAAFGRPDAKPTRVSFWMWANVTGRISLQLHGGSGTINYVAPVDIDVANTWLFKEYQIPAPSSGTWQQRDNRCQAYFGLTLAAHSLFLTNSPGMWTYHGSPTDLRSVSGQLNGMGGIGTTFRWTAVQWELGEISTPIEMLPEAIELPMLKRYYSKSFPLEVKPGEPAVNSPANVLGGFASVGNAGDGYPTTALYYTVPMRRAPTMQFYSIFTTNTPGVWYNFKDARNGPIATASGFIWREGCFPGINGASAGDAGDALFVHWVADAEINNWD
jgi:hypothetical protein